MSFTPKFVDLVRNFATVQGTGPVNPGAAVPGYTGFADATVAGDQFYYCIQGVDKPAEREVGRGTMQANGSISREPIAGPATNFSSGTKTVALVAAAEWFGKLEAAGQAQASIDVATRVALAERSVSSGSAYLTEVGREGMFTFSSADLASQVAADSGQGIYVAPASDPTGAAGAWVRKFSGNVSVKWFGAVGDGAANDGATFVAALALLKAIAVNDAGIYKGSPKLFVPAGHYFLGATTLDITHTLTIEGEGGGQAGGKVTKLRWAANTTGIRVQRYNTSSAGTTDTTTHHAGDATILRGLAMEGAYTDPASEGPHHGIHLKARATIEDVFVNNFQGNGIHVVAYAGAGGAIEGNANGFAINRVTCWYCQNGIYIDGADANAGSVANADCSYNREWGIWDSSFLGNSFYACHAADNSITLPGLPASMCSVGGNRYYAIVGQEVWASANPPTGGATSNQGWGWSSGGGPAGTTIPAWTSGMAVRAGGPYRTDDYNASNVFTGCYTEGGSGPPQLTGPTLLLGGLYGTGTQNYGGLIRGDVSAIRLNKDLAVARTLTVGGAAYVGPMAGPAADLGVYFNNTSNYTSLYFRSWYQDVEQVDATLVAQRDMGLIIDNKSACNFRINNSNILRFNAFNVDVLKPGAKLGYGDGTGGAVVQSTAKSSEVVLHKTNGQITLSNAALAAGTSVSFTLTNNILAASDTVIVNIAGGASADAYVVGVTQIAAGSCRIQLRNVSAGALAEAVSLNFAILKAVAA